MVEEENEDISIGRQCELLGSVKSLTKWCPQSTIDMWKTYMFDRITAEPDKIGGVPCIRGLRIPVSTVVGMVADGMTQMEIIESYPDLEKEDIE